MVQHMHSILNALGMGFEAIRPVYLNFSEGAAALEKVFLQHAPYDIRQCRTINACFLNQMRLAQALVLGDGGQDGELAGRQICRANLTLEYVACALACTMQEVDWRTVEFHHHARIGLLGLGHIGRLRFLHIHGCRGFSGADSSRLRRFGEGARFIWRKYDEGSGV